MEFENFYAANKDIWNKKVLPHVGSEMYDMEAFLRGKNSLRHIELEYLKGIQGKEIAHLQCHFGQDTLSLARMGAKVVGLDISDVAIEKALSLNEQLGLNAEFVQGNVLEADKILSKQFDMVFTSYGTVVWLGDINKWAKVISKLLKPGGTFLMADFHPVMYMLDDNYEQLGYPYFTQNEPFHENTTGTYADTKAEISGDQYFWNHPISSVMQALLANELELEVIREYPYSCFNCFPNLEKKEEEKFVFIEHQDISLYVLDAMEKKNPGMNLGAFLIYESIY